MKQYARLQHRRSSLQSGLTLIEVLVAIAILTIGILAVLTLFPAGFVSLQVAANSTNADRLGQAELERLNASQVELVQEIYSSDSAPNWAEDPGVELRATNKLGSDNDVNRYRQIKGETIRVPSPDSAGDALYTVLEGPIDGTSSNTDSPVVVHGLPWLAQTGDSGLPAGGSSTALPTDDPNLELPAGQPNYLIDYTNGMVAISAESYSQKITFEVEGYGQTVPTTVTYTVPAGATSTWFDPWPTAAATPPLPWVQGSSLLQRDFAFVTSKTNFTADPYQYYMYTASNSVETGNPNVGVIAFNPAGSTIKDANGKPLRAAIDYIVYDWHIIRDDRSPTAPSSTIRLSLNGVLSRTANDVLANGSKFTGLYTSGASDATNNPDFIVLNLQTGLLLTEGTDYTVNYDNGTATFIPSSPNLAQFVNQPLRFFYHARDDWAVALSKAPDLYTPSATSTLLPSLANYSISGTRVFFPRVDVGKEVQLTGVVGQNTTGNGTIPVTVADAGMFAIEPLGTNEAYIDLVSTPLTSVTSIQQVMGSSLQAQVIWQDNNNFWRHREVSTILSRQQQLASQ